MSHNSYEKRCGVSTVITDDNKMKNKKLKLLIALLLGLALTNVRAQEATTASGGDAAGIGGSVSYSVGQVAYTTSDGANGSVAAGAQQPYEISLVTGVQEANGISLTFSLYPNPTNDIIKLELKNDTAENLTYQLFDVNGKLLESKKIENTETTISMNNYISSTYFLKVIDKNKGLKTFKIIKNK